MAFPHLCRFTGGYGKTQIFSANCQHGSPQEARESLKRDVQQVPVVPVSSVDPCGSWVILGQHKGNPDVKQKKPFDLKKGPSNFLPSPCGIE